MTVTFNIILFVVESFAVKTNLLFTFTLNIIQLSELYKTIFTLLGAEGGDPFYVRENVELIRTHYYFCNAIDINMSVNFLSFTLYVDILNHNHIQFNSTFLFLE